MKDRRPYLTLTTLNQADLDECQNNLECRLEMICDIETDTETIRISDRNKYVVTGGVGYFYEARTNFPVITRTVGDWLVPDIQFSTLTLDEISNVDGKFNKYLPGGDNYSPWINKRVVVKMGLAERGSTYFTVFDGRITDVGGFKRSVKSITVTARDVFDSLTSQFPNTVFTKASFPELEDNHEGRYSPVIYGDWTINLEPDLAVIPAFAINGANPYVNGSAGDIETAGYQDVELMVSADPLTYFDSANVYFKSGDEILLVPADQITVVGTNNNRFKVKQNAATWKVGEVYKYSLGDEFYVRVKGKDLGLLSDNIVAQAKDILMTYGGLASGVFDTNWTTYQNKAAPPQSAIATFKSRIYEYEPQTAIQYALSLLEQVRLEAFISKDQKLKINALHFEDWTPQNYTIKNWDIEQGSFKPSIPDRDIFNRARGTFDYHPVRSENAQQTPVFKNQAAIAQIGKAISKQITFPNLFQADVVAAQVKEILKIASASHEIADFTATWRSSLKDVGDIVKLNIDIGSIKYENVPAMIREIGYDPVGMKLPIKAWVLQMCPASVSSTTEPGTVGGYAATIEQE